MKETKKKGMIATLSKDILLILQCMQVTKDRTKTRIRLFSKEAVMFG